MTAKLKTDGPGTATNHDYDGEVACPWCDSKSTRMVSPYGPSAAEMMFKCDDCLQGFGWMKWQHRLPA